MKVTNIKSAWFALGAAVLFAAPIGAQEPEESGEWEAPPLEYQTGDILLPNKVASLHLGTRYRYLNPGETEKLLVAWGNPPGSDTQGAVVPTDVEPFSDSGWAVILTYEEEGHIDDSDANEIDYDEMLSEMKEAEVDENQARKDAGYEAVRTVGWAEKPRYDSSAKKLYWAKELDFEGSKEHTLNYDVRVLGREGVLSMNAVASIGQLEQIRGDMRPLLEIAEFNEGYRYAEFNPKTDRLAEYGLGALIAGGVAAKLGLFAKIGAFLLAFKKFIIIGLIAIGGFVARLLGKKKETV
jgi:uncharacterized membrane-anchored protein